MPPSSTQSPIVSRQLDARIRAAFLVHGFSKGRCFRKAVANGSCANGSCDSTSSVPTHSPRRRPCRTSPNFHRARRSSVRAKPMKLLGLKSDDPVCRPIRRLLFPASLVPALVSLACAAKPLEAELRAFEAARHRCFGRFRARKLVGSDRYSKCYFAVGQCPAIMALSGFRSRVSGRQGRVAYLKGRHAGRRAQGPPAKIARRRFRPGRCRVRPPRRLRV